MNKDSERARNKKGQAFYRLHFGMQIIDREFDIWKGFPWWLLL